MIDWSRISGFEWDEGNARKNVDKHSVSPAEAEQLFFNEPLLIVSDVMHSAVEIRLHALGKTDEGRKLHATFTLRHQRSKIRVISARNMSRKEREYYEK
jgi:uncharacterized protein